jgi:UDP-glucose 4-epimerase
MKKILITGYKGMIGNRIYSYLKSLNLYNLKGIDLIDNTGDIRTLKNTEDFDIVIHCAALTSVTESINHPIEYEYTNFLGTCNLVNQFPKSKFIYLSTSAVYGEGLNHKEDGKKNPMSPYAQTKFDAELPILLFTKNPLILRLANIYGGHKGERGVYQIFEEDNECNIFGDGSSFRDYLHIDDLVKTINKGFNSTGIYNIGSGKIKTTLEIAKEFNKPINFLPERPREIKFISSDLTKARKEGLL